MKTIMTVCGTGLGSSFFVEINIGTLLQNGDFRISIRQRMEQYLRCQKKMQIISLQQRSGRYAELSSESDRIGFHCGYG